MKQILLGCAALVVSAGIANAADLPAKAPAYRAAPIFNWSGVYGGISGGYAWAENKFNDGVPPFSGKIKPTGWFGGAQIGYNNQFAPHWLIGGEIDISGGDIDDSIPSLAGRTRDKFDAFGTARTRFGYVQDRALIYATGGAIWLKEDFRSTVGGASATTLSQYHVGWVFGGGIEYAVDNRWSWKLEYLYAPLDRSRDNINGVGRTTDVDFSVVRAGLNYRFGGNEPVAPAMPVKSAAWKSSWSGSYLGLHGGYGWSKFDESIVAFGLTNISSEPDGGYGGFQSGYNWLFGPNALFGVEVDSSFGDLKDSTSPNGINTVHAKIEDLGTARLRLGYLATPDTLLYVTGGAAYAREKTTISAVTTFNSKVDHLGWTLGAGVEYKFAPEWSLKAEYLYADLGDYHITGSIAGATRTSDLTLNTVRVGVNYSGPVIERFFGGR
jgi:outer membrane immunogenic protein